MFSDVSPGWPLWRLGVSLVSLTALEFTLGSAVTVARHGGNPENHPTKRRDVVNGSTLGTEECRRPSEGGIVGEPEDLGSRNGVLKVDLSFRNYTARDGSMRYCYVDRNGNESPTLRVNPGDLVILSLKNDLVDPHPGRDTDHHSAMHSDGESDSCTSRPMTEMSTNLHFHGLTIPPICHQDDVLSTSIQPGDPPFEYRFRIPRGQPPGLYWYHPHMHGLTKAQVLGGASDAIIV
jgi:Multicopper oxidase